MFGLVALPWRHEFKPAGETGGLFFKFIAELIRLAG
jgi:hypothetical protein